MQFHNYGHSVHHGLETTSGRFHIALLNAAYVAADQINKAADLLPGVELEVVAVNSSLCGQPKGSETSALVEFTREVYKERQCGECLPPSLFPHI